MSRSVNKRHPVVAKIDYEASIRGLSCEDIATVLHVSRDTYYHRKNNPKNFSVAELMRLAKKFKWTVIIDGDDFKVCDNSN